MTDSVQIFPAGWRLDDADGNPVSGAKLKFYSAGTTTPLSVYADAELATPLGTTVYCDTGGYPVTSMGSSTKTLIFAGITDYKIVITDADDVTLATHDNVPGALDTSGFIDTSAATPIPVTSKTTDYQILDADQGKLINANCTGGSFELTLPSALTVGDGWSIGVRHAGSANTVTVKTTSGQTIAGPGQSSQVAMTLRGLGQTVWLVSDGAGWTVSSEVPAIMTGQAVYTTVVSRRSATPVNPDIGSRYIISDTPTGAWLTAGFAVDDLVEYIGSATWSKYPLVDGLLARVVEEQVTYAYNTSTADWEAWSNVLTPSASTRASSRFGNVVGDGSGGGTATSGAWTTIPITSEFTREIGYASTGATLATNQITIPQGAYRITINQPFFGTYVSRIRFRPVTQTSSWDNTRYSDTVVAGSNDVVGTPIHSTATAIIADEIIIDATSETFILEYYVSNTKATDGLGTPSGSTGAQETFARVFIESIEALPGPQGEPGVQGDDGLEIGRAHV